MNMNNQNYNNNNSCPTRTKSNMGTQEAMNINHTNPKHEDWEHVHEITGSTMIVKECKECHNHRFCAVSGKPIKRGNSHVHEVTFNTDSSDCHCHKFCGKTSPAIEICDGKHVHYVNAVTESSDGHVHKFQATSLIQSPTDFECRE